jgi:transposase
MPARHLASIRQARLKSPGGSIRHTLHFLARRWPTLDAENTELETMAEILIVVSDNPERFKSEAALAKRAGISPILASSGMTSGRHGINHGGHRRLNAATYHTVIVRMRFHQPTIDFVARRNVEGLSKRHIIRCFKRYAIREVFHLIRPAENAILKVS